MIDRAIRRMGSVMAGLGIVAGTAGSAGSPRGIETAATAPDPVATVRGELPLLNDSNWIAWRDHILPAEADVAWERIPWIPALGEGVRRANAEDRPVLVWVMNGHPLACT